MMKHPRDFSIAVTTPLLQATGLAQADPLVNAPERGTHGSRDPGVRFGGPVIARVCERYPDAIGVRAIQRETTGATPPVTDARSIRPKSPGVWPEIRSMG